MLGFSFSWHDRLKASDEDPSLDDDLEFLALQHPQSMLAEWRSFLMDLGANITVADFRQLV